MRYFLLGVLVACSGESSTEDCDPVEMDVHLTVTDPAGLPVIGAPVKLDGEVCADNGDGTYDCVALPDSENQLSIIDTRYDVHAEFLVLEFGCKNEVYNHEVQLGAMMGS